jgi:hypothetical protein
MIHLLFSLSLAALGAPQDIGPVPETPTAQEPAPKSSIIAPLDRRWRARKEVKKDLFEAGGQALVDHYQAAWIWLSAQTPAEGLMPSEEGRAVGVSALAALSMTGNSSGLLSGAQKDQLRVLVRGMRAVQDAESGAIGPKEAPEFLLDHALALHALAEAQFTNPIPVNQNAAQKAVDALVAARSEDGVWHVGGKADKDVDALVTGIAAYALYTADDGGSTVDPAVYQAIAEWSAKAAQIEPSADAEGATTAAAILCARIFAHQGSGQSLSKDESLSRLLAAMRPYLSSLDTKDKAADAKAADAKVTVLTNDFAYLGSVVLYQADSIAWNQLFRAIQARSLKEAVAEGEHKGAIPAGPNGRLPKGILATTSLRLLQLQSGKREPALSCFAP